MSNTEHSTFWSYVTGFSLSFLFTAIPYYLVVSKTVSGDSLLVTILGFALLQMVVQIFFFLHLGSGPKPLYNIAFFIATLGIILIVVVGSLFIMSHLHHYMTPTDVTTKLAEDEGISQVEDKKTGACEQTYTNHQVIINGSTLSPQHIDAHLCDTLTFIAQDNAVHQIGFGSHPKHTDYSGEDDLLVRKGHNYTITLNQSGAYNFHDHLHPDLVGSFTVAP